MTDSSQDKPDSAPKKGMGTWLGIIGIIISIAALALAALLWKNYEQLTLITNNANLSHTQKSDNLQNNINQLQSDFSSTQNKISHLMQSVGNTEQQNTLSQIAYLLNLADLQLSVGHDASASLHLLSTAQEKVESLNDPRLFALNKTLVADIDALKNTPKFNITTIISQIETLNHNIELFSLTPNKDDLKKSLQSAEKVTADTSSNQKEPWYKRFFHHLSGLKNLVIIRRTNANIMPLLSAEQQSILKATLQGKLLLIEYAAIKHNNTLYQQLLSTAQAWVSTYYFNSDNRNILQTQLSALQKINVEPKVPDISDSLTILNQTLANMIQINAPSRRINIFEMPDKTPARKAGVAA